MRTTLFLPDALHQRLKIQAGREEKSVSRIVQDLLESSLARREAGDLGRMYRVLGEMEGLGGRGDSRASSTIDELLYNGGKEADGSEPASPGR